MGGSGGPTTYEAFVHIGGGTGGRVMPGPARLPKNGARDVFSYVQKTTGTAPPAVAQGGNISTAAWENANGNPLGDVYSLSQVSPIGGGPNETGMNFIDPVSDPENYWNPAPISSDAYWAGQYGSPRPTITVSTFDVFTDAPHADASGVFVEFGSRLDAHNLGYFRPAFPSLGTIMLTGGAGGGGWGAAGGDSYGWNTHTSGIAYGGAGGPAVKTNGHAVTWTGGQGTDRVFGAVA
jgi:hypothetical protein